MDDFRVKKAAEVLKRFFDTRTIQDASRFEAFRSTWKQIVGSRLADHSKPKSILHRTLLIAADHSGWIQLLQMDQERILERISKHYPELDITSLAFSVENVNEQLDTVITPFHAELHEDRSEKNDDMEASAPMENTQASTQSFSSSPGPAKNSDLPQPLGEIFSRMREKDAQRAREKGN